MIWDPLKHPRGRDGRFIEVGALIRFLVDGRRERSGRVMAIDPDGRVRVSTSDGREHTVPASQVIRTVRERTRLDSPEPGDGEPIDLPEQAQAGGDYYWSTSLQEFYDRLSRTGPSPSEEDQVQSKAALEAAQAHLDVLPQDPAQIGRAEVPQTQLELLRGAQWPDWAREEQERVDTALPHVRSLMDFFDSFGGADDARIRPPTPAAMAWFKSEFPDEHKALRKELGTVAPARLKKMTVREVLDTENEPERWGTSSWHRPAGELEKMERALLSRVRGLLAAEQGRYADFAGLDEKSQARLDHKAGWSSSGKTIRETIGGALPDPDWGDYRTQSDNFEYENSMVAAWQGLRDKVFGWENYAPHLTTAESYTQEAADAWWVSPVDQEHRDLLKADPLLSSMLRHRLDDPELTYQELINRSSRFSGAAYSWDLQDPQVLREAMDRRDAWHASLPIKVTARLDVDPVDQGPGHTATAHFDAIEQAGRSVSTEVRRRLTERGFDLDARVVLTQERMAELGTGITRLKQYERELLERMAWDYLEHLGIPEEEWKAHPDSFGGHPESYLRARALREFNATRDPDDQWGPWRYPDTPLYKEFREWGPVAERLADLRYLEQQLRSKMGDEPGSLRRMHHERSAVVRVVLMEMGVDFGLAEGEKAPYVFVRKDATQPDWAVLAKRVQAGETIRFRAGKWSGDGEPGRTIGIGLLVHTIDSVREDGSIVYRAEGSGDVRTIQDHEVILESDIQDMWQARADGHPIAEKLFSSMAYVPRPMLDEMMSSGKPVSVNYAPKGTRASRGSNSLTMDEKDPAWTYVHEEHHGVQWSSKWVGTMEWAWRARAVTEGEIGARTMREGEKYHLRKLNEIHQGSVYTDTEMAFEDDTWEAYATKVYGTWRPPGGGASQGTDYSTSELLPIIAQGILTGDGHYQHGMSELQMQRVREAEEFYLGLVLALKRGHTSGVPAEALGVTVR